MKISTFDDTIGASIEEILRACMSLRYGEINNIVIQDGAIIGSFQTIESIILDKPKEKVCSAKSWAELGDELRKRLMSIASKRNDFVITQIKVHKGVPCSVKIAKDYRPSS